MAPKNKRILDSVGESIAGLFGRKNRSVIVAPPRLTDAVRFPYGPFQGKFQLPRGAGYEVHASTNLQNWEIILTGKAGPEPIDFVDSDASKHSYRFYRVQAETVRSVNVVGYVTENVPPGYSMIANPLQASTNTVSAILAGVPDGTMLNKFDTHLFKLSENAVANGKWVKPDETLVPGEGAIFFNPTSDFRTLNFAGEVLQGELLMPIAAGFSVRSSQIPKPGRIHGDLGFPISEGDVVHLFDRDRQKYVIYEFDPKKWESNPPVVAVGEAFWIGKTKPGNWVQHLLVQ
jgi:hypothetical protein